MRPVLGADHRLNQANRSCKISALHLARQSVTIPPIRQLFHQIRQAPRQFQPEQPPRRCCSYFPSCALWHTPEGLSCQTAKCSSASRCSRLLLATLLLKRSGQKRCPRRWFTAKFPAFLARRIEMSLSTALRRCRRRASRAPGAVAA